MMMIMMLLMMMMMMMMMMIMMGMTTYVMRIIMMMIMILCNDNMACKCSVLYRHISSVYLRWILTCVFKGHVFLGQKLILQLAAELQPRLGFVQDSKFTDYRIGLFVLVLLIMASSRRLWTYLTNWLTRPEHMPHCWIIQSQCCWNLLPN